MIDPAGQNIYRLQGALHRIAKALRSGRENLFRALMLHIDNEELVRKMPSVVELDKALGKPIGDVTRRELIEMWLGKDDLEAVETLLRDLDDGNFDYSDTDECLRQIGALRRLLEG